MHSEDADDGVAMHNEHAEQARDANGYDNVNESAAEAVDARADAQELSQHVHVESARVHSAYSVAQRVLDQLERQCVEERVNTADLLSVLVSEEANMFSSTPPYVDAAQAVERAARARRASELAQHVSPYRAASLQADETKAMAQHFVHATRAYVDPSIPLRPPFDYMQARRSGVQSERVGTYHDLFHPPRNENGAAQEPTTYTGRHGARAQPTPKQTPRQQKSHSRASSQRTAPSSEPTPRRALKVGRDFVPACATPGYRSRASVSPSTTNNSPS